jgi:hypothetical protein
MELENLPQIVSLDEGAKCSTDRRDYGREREIISRRRLAAAQKTIVSKKSRLIVFRSSANHTPSAVVPDVVDDDILDRRACSSCEFARHAA